MHNHSYIQPRLQKTLEQSDHIDKGQVWTIQTGGRTNMVWRVSGSEDLICKLYMDASANPLYSNQPETEYACLVTLEEEKVAPRPKAFLETEFGSVLLYYYVDGEIWSEGAYKVARLLGRLRSLKPPKGLRQLATDPEIVLQQGQDILAKLPESKASELRKFRPEVDSDYNVSKVLVHTDVVPGNLVSNQNGLCLIDWQCPALGDAVIDVAMFLSPAMHHIYGGKELSHTEVAGFLGGLPKDLVERYHKVGLAYHWRLAAYCAWRVQQGHHAYAAAGEKELALLK